MPGPSQPLGETNTTPSGLIARLVTRPRPGSPPRVRLSPRPRPRLKPHTRPVARHPVPKPSYPLVQEIQPGHTYMNVKVNNGLTDGDFDPKNTAYKFGVK